MNETITLPTTPLDHPAMDYAFLRREGIRHLERMAGQLWTDFNAHDPGITILEQVCYALTDLAYRINHDLPDLLSSGGEAAYDSLYSPAQILPGRPVTLSDLRKLVIDVEGVKNAWVEKVEAQQPPLYFQTGENELSLQGDALIADPVYLKGLYRVKIEISDLLYIESTVNQGEVQRQVARRLHANRNLGEDFEAIEVLTPEYIQVQARVEIEAVEDAEAILLEIYRRLADHISPPVPFYTLSQLLEAGKPVDEIFEGPLLDHGFIDSEALKQAQRRTALHTSDLIQEIMDVPGVRAVRNISLTTGGGSDTDTAETDTAQTWSLNLNPALVPKLDISGSTIHLERNRLKVGVDVAGVVDAYYQGLRHAADFEKLGLAERDLQPPSGRDRRVGDYYSLQHQLPAAYGIGALGLPDSASPQRQAQAKQLKAYLMFFDQLLANYFTQLAHVKDLFSFFGSSMAGVAAPTYFSQPVTDPNLGLNGIRELEPAHQGRLQTITENPHATPEATSAQPGFRRRSSNRRNRFLNHLLARFAEQFTEYSLILYGVMPQARASAAEKLVQDKQTFLQEYPQLSSARGLAFNYLEPRNNLNRSGLEQRIKRKLGLVDEQEDFYIVEHILLRPMKYEDVDKMEGDTQQQIPILINPEHKDPYSLQISFVFPNWPPRFGNSDFKAFIERTIYEETPAHLTPYIHWLDQAAMMAFEIVYRDWLEKRRAYFTGQLGV